MTEENENTKPRLGGDFLDKSAEVSGTIYGLAIFLLIFCVTTVLPLLFALALLRFIWYLIFG